MNMYYCNALVASDSIPPSIECAYSMMKKAYRCAFLNKNEIEIFCSVLNNVLVKDMSEGIEFFVHHFDYGDSGMVILDFYGSPNAAVSLSYSKIKKVLEYDLDAKDFFDVSDRLQEGGAA